MERATSAREVEDIAFLLPWSFALGLVCLNGSILLGLLFSSGELLISLLLAGPTFFMWAGRWERFKDDDPAFRAARKLNYSTITVLASASILNLCSGIFGAIFKPGFVGWYAVSFMAGLILMLAGTVLTVTSATVGSHHARQLALAPRPASASGSLPGRGEAQALWNLWRKYSDRHVLRPYQASRQGRTS